MKRTEVLRSVMKRAWSIYRGSSIYSYSFSESLRRAWKIEKENAAERLEEYYWKHPDERPESLAEKIAR
ncbi:hypothetical protein [Parabacteroides sp. Marseille-P3160]|uniref:hypothetical protein n=1 Tax=Parabacteroides sp. Marseille-P3160 TaxID=1917887 RepID=UPI0009BB5AB5|nr:hypothetical protein [Parabacteroides sp. Marseille-P3160]